VARAGEQSDERRFVATTTTSARALLLRHLLLQKLIDGRVVFGARPQSRHARHLAHAEGPQHVEVAVDGVLLRVFDGRARVKVREEVERAAGPACEKTLARAGEKSEQIRLRQTVQVDDEVVTLAPHVFDELHDTQNRHRLRPVA
jgi:hypothetical protein